MGKIKIRLLPDGSIKMETEGIKGAKCMDYAKILERLADAKIESIEKTSEYYESDELLDLDEMQNLRDN